MSGDSKIFTIKHLLSALLIIGFGWGALWSLTQGIDLRIRSDFNTANTNNVILSPSTSTITQPQPSSLSKIKRLKIVIGGDVMMDRGIRLIGNRYGYDSLLKNIIPVFQSADIAIINLEGTVTSNPSKTLLPNGFLTKELYFTFATTTAGVLADVGVDYVSLANNHTDNFKMNGFQETKEWLTKSNIGYFGGPWNSSSTEALIEKDGFKVALVGYHEFQPGLARITNTIKRLNDEGYFVIVVPHWGDEYITTAPERVQEKAQSFIEAGAHAIIGSHPHVVIQPTWIDNVPVFYSLGNLLFDQYFSKEVMRGNIVELDINNNDGKYDIENIFIYETSLTSRKGVEIVSGPTPFAQ